MPPQKKTKRRPSDNGTLLLDALEAAKEYIGINQVRRAIVIYKLAPQLKSESIWVPDIQETDARKAVADAEAFAKGTTDKPYEHAYITLLYNNHYSSLLLTKSTRTCVLFDSSWNTGAYEPYGYLEELQQTLQKHGFSFRSSLKQGCQHRPKTANTDVLSDDTFCQTWALYLPMRFLMSGKNISSTSFYTHNILSFIAHILDVFWTQDSLRLNHANKIVSHVLGGWYAQPGLFDIVFNGSNEKFKKYKRQSRSRSQKFRTLTQMKRAIQQATEESYKEAFWGELDIPTSSRAFNNKA